MLKMLYILSFIFLPVFQLHAAETIMITTTLAPISDLVQKIGGDQFKYNTLINSGMDPHTYSPTPNDIKKLNQSKLFFSIGLPIEKIILKKLGKTQITNIKLDENISKLPNSDHHDMHEKHGQHHELEQEFDTHIWLSPSRLLIILKDIKKSLEPLVTDKQQLENNYRQVYATLGKLHEQNKTILQKYQGRYFLVFHPSFGYFAEDYGLKQLAIEFNGKTPTPKHLKEIIELTQEHQIKTIFIQPQFSQDAAKLIANSIKGSYETLDPLKSDIIENLNDITLKLVRSFGK